MPEHTPSQLLRLIPEALSPDALAYWNGMPAEVRDEWIIEAQRHGLEAAIEGIEEAATT